MEIPISLDPDARLLTDEELTTALGQLDERSAPYRALLQLLNTHFAHAVGSVTSPTLSEREAGHAAGRIEAITTFRSDLKQRRASLQKVAPRRK
jgi:hypothetical protein